MDYKVCILTAGRGTRNKYVKTNKALLPLGEGTALSYQISKFPPDTEIVIVVGYNAPFIKDYTRQMKNVTRVYAQFEGVGVGPGYSLLHAKPLLQCPFVYMACDTIVLDDIPEPTKNWIGVSGVEEREPYLTIATREPDLVEEVYDKGDKRATYLASIGLVGVKDYKDFWEGLANPTIVQNEHQDTSGINALIPHKLYFKCFKWCDIGSTTGYERTIRYFNKTLSK